MLKYITLAAIVYFFYWFIKQKIHNRKLAEQGFVIEQKGIRPVTLLSLVLLVMYGGYMVYFFFFNSASS